MERNLVREGPGAEEECLSGLGEADTPSVRMLVLTNQESSSGILH